MLGKAQLINVVDSISANLLGLNITNDIMWNAHISETIKKAGKQLYSLLQLKRASVSRKDLCLFLFYMYMLDSRLNRPVIHFALPAYLSQELLESVQIKALQITCPDSYWLSLLFDHYEPSIHLRTPPCHLWAYFGKYITSQ